MEDFDYQKFWDLYQAEDGGIEACINYARDFAQDDETYEKVIQEHVPGLIEVAKEREVEMLKFLSDLDELEQREMADADGTSDDVGGISPDSDSEAGDAQDEAEPSEARADDGEDRGSDEESPAG